MGISCNGKLQYIWKNINGVKLCKSCASKQAPKANPTDKKRYIIPARSTKKEKQDALYKIVRDAYLKVHPQCEAAIPGICSRKGSSQIHHKKGKVGEDYLDDKYFLAVDFECHRYIEDNRQFAIGMGFSELRLKNYDDEQ